ncbi:hypothetical protein SUSP_000621 [Sulfurospirillum sp. 'SP']|nr:hypothetical protein [Sulfurospirillum sp. 'SP']WNY98203.1 hypothetical protein SUSP_000621 [Sulfurospirillum sp. 'SP']
MRKITTSLLVFIGLLVLGCAPKEEAKLTPVKIEPAQTAKQESKATKTLEIDKETGLIKAEGFEIVKANCTVACHSATLVTQNRGNEKYWKDAIVYMQKNQGLWDLGADEPRIINYLATHYGQSPVYRRAPLKVKWQE